MTLTLEWRHRIDNWRKELGEHFYRPLAEITVTGFLTYDQLNIEQALAEEYIPMLPGTAWGAKWQYGWFKTEVVIPEKAHGQRVVVKVDTGAESAVYVDGVAAGAYDREHAEITLTRAAVPGARYQVVLESYGGHGPMVMTAGPNRPGRETVPEPPETQRVVGTSTFGIWDEDVYQLWIDIQTLYEIREHIDPNSLRVAEIDAALRQFTITVDFELPHAEMLKTVRACRAELKPLLECVNGSSTPTMYAFGHAHIDVAWLWPLAETERKCVRTFSTALTLMEEYPEYKFLQSQPHLYWMMKNKYPALYERIKIAVKQGQWLPEGGAWVEPDTNVSGGEALIRQFVHGMRFFKEEFDVDCEMLWLPDVFGYSGALPQIMRGCGVKYFATQKLDWAYNGGDPFPYNTFVWEGIDGSQVYAHLYTNYNALTNPSEVIQRWDKRIQKDGYTKRPYPFGYGDGGGGPTRNHLEFARREKNLEGVPKVTISAPNVYFEEQLAEGWPEARYIGELYLQCHRGTYTSQAKTKWFNRKCELALREAEMWGAAASALKNYTFPLSEMDAAWKVVLLNQFHDILPGSSIHRVYEEAEASYAEVMETANHVSEAAAENLLDAKDGVTIFNSLSWERSALVPLPEGFNGARDAQNQALPVQVDDEKTWVEVNTPACGWTTLAAGEGEVVENTLVASETVLENAYLRAEFSQKGEIVHLLDKETGRELAAGACNSFKMYKDVPTMWDAWDLDSMYEQTPVELDSDAEIEVVAVGPLFAKLRIRRTLNQSELVQEIVLRRDSRRLDFHTVIDWQESHKLLKVNFPVTVHANEAIHEIQFGHLRRPNHFSRQFDADRFEVSNHKWTALAEEKRGCAVLNDSKYGINVFDNSINLTLLKSALAPDMTADKGRQEFSYAFYAWNGAFSDSGLVQQGYDLNCPPTYTDGAAGETSMFSLDGENVIIEAVKPAEDGSGDIVVRLYESMRTATCCQLAVNLPVKSVHETDMLENVQAEMPFEEGKLALDFRPFEIKTLRLRV